MNQMNYIEVEKIIRRTMVYKKHPDWSKMYTIKNWQEVYQKIIKRWIDEERNNVDIAMVVLQQILRNTQLTGNFEDDAFTLMNNMFMQIERVEWIN